MFFFNKSDKNRRLSRRAVSKRSANIYLTISLSSVIFKQKTLVHSETEFAFASPFPDPKSNRRQLPQRPQICCHLLFYSSIELVVGLHNFKRNAILD